MPLLAGTRIGHYEIVAPLGAGGMGEVYRARDTRLQRDVAIKVLPADMATDKERLSRFDREARTLASLNHPHIAQIHGIEDRAIIMELVEGEDLAQRLAHGRVPIDEVLAIAGQIADALDAAHAAGIVHRDLKPANIRIRPDGTIKVLDFGLAKGTLSPDVTSLRPVGDDTSTPGMILGTAVYMSPEQARGRSVDKRTDIWAFGCVVYELLAGRQAFAGDTVTDVLGAIVTREPQWEALPPDTPQALRHLLRRCLQKDASKRLRDIGDARSEINDIALAPSAPAPQAEAPARAHVPPQRSTRSLARLALAVLAMLAIVGTTAAAVAYLWRPVGASRVQKLTIAVAGDGIVREPVISPDGTRVAFVAPAKARLSVRALSEWSARELEGTEGAVRPFWSPDSQWIGYFRNEQLLKVPAAGGPVVRIATLPPVQVPLRISSGAWTEDGRITLSNGTGGLLRVPASGGELTELSVRPPAEHVLLDLRALPNGALLARLSSPDDKNSIVVIDQGAIRVVYEGGDLRRATYAPPGHLIFSGGGAKSVLWAVAFDLAQLAVTGEPFVIGEGAEPTVDHAGTLSFVPTADVARDLSWFTLDGRVGPRLAEPREWIEGASVSRDGRRVLASTSEGIWAYDTDTGARSRVTTGAYDITPQWVDANRIVFVRTENLQPVVVLKDLRAAGGERVLVRRARFPRVTADGRRVVFNLQDENRPGGWMVAWIDLDDPSEIHRLPEVHFGARFPSVSPDGSLVAYVSGEVGRDEIYLTRLPSGEGKWQISTSGGGWTLFHPGGNAVIYRTPDNVMMSVPVTGGADVKVGLPHKLFDWGGAWAPFYDFDASGQRGIAAIPLGNPTSPPSISIVENWFLEFR